tara:strand:+ start:616 stop:1032 length:417 start_codon:yes stop_codon:yes gene_type:complete
VAELQLLTLNLLQMKTEKPEHKESNNPPLLIASVIERFNISDGLKNHYLFEYPINQLIDTFVLVFEKEKKELLRIFEKRLEALYGEPSFSTTIYSISDMIVYKYFNDDLSFVEKAFVKSSKFNEYFFRNKIIDMERDS